MPSEPYDSEETFTLTLTAKEMGLLKVIIRAYRKHLAKNRIRMVNKFGDEADMTKSTEMTTVLLAMTRKIDDTGYGS
jgi:hypothetical protein